MDSLNSYILWWHWIVIGVIFITVELFIPSFIIIWLGVSAIIIGILDYIYNLNFVVELYLWSGLSTALLLAWFGYFKRTWRSNIGQSKDEYANIYGRITEVLGNRRYRAEFDLPVLGDRRWIVESHQDLRVGDKIIITKVYGQILRVKRVKGVKNDT